METKEDDRAEVVKSLIAKRDDIRETLFNARDQLNAIRGMKSFDLEAILAVAQNVSYSGHAPPGWVPGAPLLKNHPPAPQPEEMRGGMLEKYNLQCKARKDQSGVDTNINRNESSASARELYHSMLNAKINRNSVNQLAIPGADPSEVLMEVDEPVPEAAIASLEDVHMAKGRKANTISFTSYDDDSSDDDS